jgi:hypothetical protein
MPDSYRREEEVTHPSSIRARRVCEHYQARAAPSANGYDGRPTNGLRTVNVSKT